MSITNSLKVFLQGKAVDRELRDIMSHSHSDEHFSKVLAQWIMDPKNFGRPSYTIVAKWLFADQSKGNLSTNALIGFCYSGGVVTTDPRALVNKLGSKVDLKLAPTETSTVSRILDLFISDADDDDNIDNVELALMRICQLYIATSSMFQVHRSLAQKMETILSEGSELTQSDVENYIFALQELLDGKSDTFLPLINALADRLMIETSDDNDIQAYIDSLEGKAPASSLKAGFGG